MSLSLSLAKDFCGKIIVADIGIPNDIIEEAGFEAEIITESNGKGLCSEVDLRTQIGEVLELFAFLCGSENMPGSSAFSIESRLGFGSGPLHCGEYLKT